MAKERIEPFGEIQNSLIEETINEEATVESIIDIDDVPVPTILVSTKAYEKMQCIIQECGEDEISWLGTVKPMPDNEFLISDVVLFQQKVSLGSTEFDQGDLGKFYATKLKENPANKEMLGSLLFWGHVHPDDVGPSIQDNDQMKLFAHNKFFIRGIFNRSNKAKFDFYDYTKSIKIINCPWKLSIEDTKLKESIIKEIKEKVKKEPLVWRYSKYGIS
jgi:hypothetical protein